MTVASNVELCVYSKRHITDQNDVEEDAYPTNADGEFFATA